MKTSVKILILVISLAIVAGSILFFFKAIAAPPVSAEISEQHISDINENIGKINDDISEVSLEETFLSTDRKISLWKENGLINTSMYDESIRAFLEHYVPVYVSQTKSHLKQNNWGDSEREKIETRVNYLRKEELSNNMGVVISYGSKMSDNLSELEKICDNYTEASKLLRNCSFKSLTDSKMRIEKSQDFVNDEYIGNSDLNSGLKEFPCKLGDSHYRYLSYQLGLLSNWRYVSLSTTEGNFKQFNKTCDDYKNANIYGDGHPKSVFDMKSDAQRYMSSAYDEKCSLSVDGKSYDISYSLDADGGIYTFTVNTNHPDGYKVSLPDFCSLSNKNGDSFKINLKENKTSSSRSGVLTVTAGKKSIKVSVTQKESEKPSVSISSVTVDHNVYQNGEKGMRINVSISANNMSGKKLSVVAWFYFKDGTKLKDSNRNYRTTDGQVSTSESEYISGDNDRRTVTLFLPYSELHISSKGEHSLKFDIGVFESHKQLTVSSYYYFLYTI